jgi:hypothetical protein
VELGTWWLAACGSEGRSVGCSGRPGGVLVSVTVLFGRYLSLMLEIAISLIVGFALGYGVREWVFRRYRRAEQRRRRPF